MGKPGSIGVVQTSGPKPGARDFESPGFAGSSPDGDLGAGGGDGYRTLHVPVSEIDVDEQQLRYDPEDDGIVELAADIARNGLLQPVGVVRKAGGRWQLLWGGRRLCAHKRLRCVTIFARVYETRDESVKVVALRENLQRRQMTLGEECDAVAFLHVHEDKSPDQIASQLGKGRAWVLRRLMVPGLPVELREPVLEGTLALGSAEEIALVADAGARALILQHTLQSKLGLSQVRAMCAVYRETPSVAAAVDAGVAAASAVGPVAELSLPCQACGVMRLLSATVVIRVCRDGCGSPAKAKEGDL